MHSPPFLTDLLVVLAAAVVVVPIVRRLRSSPVLGYLAAGILVGPHALGMVENEQALHAVGEFGVVFMLFMIGLELSLQRLWVMRRVVFGLGLAQVAVTSALIGTAALALGQPPAAALVIGGALALSSTAFVLQLLAERGEQMTRHGRHAFAILLFQDLAVLPLLVVIPLLAGESSTVWRAVVHVAVVATLTLGGIILAGRFLLQPAFRVVAATNSNELFAIATLTLVLGTGWVTQQAGMSMTLGAFIAGLLVAETAYRHQIEADIRPFRGILLGLFFMSTGSSMDLPLIAANGVELLVLLAALLTLKAAVILALTRVFRLAPGDGAQVALSLAQGGEFAFVALTLASGLGVVAPDTSQTLMATVALSLLVTPGLAALGRFVAKRLDAAPVDDGGTLAEEGAGFHHHLVIAGYGRVGRTVARLAALERVPWLALDTDHARVCDARASGLPVFFGDTTRAEVLDAAGLGRARALVVTLNSPIATSRALAAVRAHWRQLPVVARAHDHAHAQQLRHLGATATVAEAAESSLQLGGLSLTTTGSDPQRVQEHIAAMRTELGAMLGIDAPAPPKRTKAAPAAARSRDKETEAPAPPTSQG
ncbi:MAG: monovalent cation:proton antiporter-2 (CPA2) family protein [Alphaproteobacteria bacterium]